MSLVLRVGRIRRGNAFVYAVMQGDRQVGGTVETPGEARRLKDRLHNDSEVPKVTKRACLKCGGTVLSTGPHHRLCTICRTVSD